VFGVGGIYYEVVAVEGIFEIRTFAVSKGIYKTVETGQRLAFFDFHFPGVEEAFADGREHVVAECACAKLFPALLRLTGVDIQGERD